MLLTAPSGLVDAAVNRARSLPELIRQLNTIDPSLGQQISGKALIGSKSPWGTLAVGVVGWAAAKYGLGWSDDVVELVAGAAVVVGAYLMRYFTKTPVSGVVTAAKPPL